MCFCFNSFDSKIYILKKEIWETIRSIIPILPRVSCEFLEMLGMRELVIQRSMHLQRQFSAALKTYWSIDWVLRRRFRLQHVPSNANFRITSEVSLWVSSLLSYLYPLLCFNYSRFSIYHRVFSPVVFDFKFNIISCPKKRELVINNYHLIQKWFEISWRTVFSFLFQNIIRFRWYF